MKYFVTWK